MKVLSSSDELLIQLLPTLIPARFVAEIPANLQDVVPLVAVGVHGGPRNYSLAKPTVDFDCYVKRDVTVGGYRKAALDLAELVTATLLSPNFFPTVVNGNVVGVLGCLAVPASREYDNPAVARAGCTFALTVH